MPVSTAVPHRAQVRNVLVDLDAAPEWFARQKVRARWRVSGTRVRPVLRINHLAAGLPDRRRGPLAGGHQRQRAAAHLRAQRGV